MTVGSSTQHRLVFLPGFVLPTSAYWNLLAPLVDADIRLDVPQLYRVGPRALLGRYTVRDEAIAAANLITASPSQTVWIGGHSRGGHGALLASRLLAQRGFPVAGLILIDPVRDGPLIPDGFDLTVDRAEQESPLIVGAGLGGKCAPAARNHRHFARGLPSSLHVMVSDMGHADILTGRSLTLGRRLCGGGDDPATTRNLVAHLMVDYMAHRLVPGSKLAPGAVWEPGSQEPREGI